MKKYKPKCLKGAISKKQSAEFYKMSQSKDKEVRILAKSLIWNLPVVKHNIKIFRKYFAKNWIRESEFIKSETYDTYIIRDILRMITK